MVKISPVHRHKTIPVNIGGVYVGGGYPIAVQSMTNTDTADYNKTADQIMELHEVGSEIVRITINNEESARSVPKIRDILIKKQCDVPIVGCFHYNGHTLLKQHPECAEAIDKFRINPGNVGFGKNRDVHFEDFIKLAIKHDKPIRIGVNWGSLDKSVLMQLMDQNAQSEEVKPSAEIMREALIVSALTSADKARTMGLGADKIVISCKTSRVPDLISIYTELAERSNYALHVGLTEAGMGNKGVVATTAALATLLQKGIGDTIRASLTPNLGGSRTTEVKVCQEILQSLQMRAFTPQVSACPGCGRTTSTYFQELAGDIESFIVDQMPIWKRKYRGVESMNVAVMGCIVNGPGESKHADIGISLPGSGESPVAPVFIDGKKSKTLRGDNISSEFKQILQYYVEQKYSGG